MPAAAALTLGLLPGAALETVAGRRFAWAPMVMLGLAGLVLEGVTNDPWVRGGMLLLGPVAIAAAWGEARLAWLPMVGAALSTLGLLGWAVPGFTMTAEEITVEGVIQGVLPGSWAPAAIVPFLEAAAWVAVVHAAAGVWKERRSAAPVAWAALVGAVPVVVLAVAYVQVGRFQSSTAWAAAALGLAVALVGAAAAARGGESGLQRPGCMRRGRWRHWRWGVRSCWMRRG